MKTILFSKKPPRDPELELLKGELDTAREDLQQAYRLFNQAVDPELVESCIYEINAVKSRCNYLIRAIKTHSPEESAALGTEGKEGITWT